MIEFALYVLLGVVAGIASGIVGVGGGTILIPAFVLLLGLSQKQAQGTTLALMLPPIGLLAAWTYYKHGYVVVPLAIFVCVGFFFGGLLGAKIAVDMPTDVLKKVFATFIIAIGTYMLFSK